MIRNYRSEDLPYLKQIANQAWKNIYAIRMKQLGEDLHMLLGKNDPENEKGRQIELHFKMHPNWGYVCEESGQIVGFVTFFLDHDLKIGEIGNNAVAPDCGLKGIGQQMYKASLERFKLEGMLYAKVQTGLDEAHAPARRAYERAGFTIHQDITNYYKKI